MKIVRMLGWVAGLAGAAMAADRPHVVLVMADDMGWGQTGYRGHPVLKTPHLDAMAAAGLRFERFYAGAPNCSPTRATVLTGRTNDRAGVENHGYALRRQEKTLPQAMKAAGYATGHFGKWHLNGFRGPGAPILGADTHSPGAFGFDEWVSATNFFDRDPLLSRKGKIEEFRGDSSEIAVDEAVKFIRAQVRAGKPTFTVIWYGSPHSPMRAAEADKAGFAALEPYSADHYGELVAMDRSIGTLRRALRELGIAENTLLWFKSDNGGLPEVKPDTVGGLRGFKGTVYEGGLRVPGIVEWPARIKPRVTAYPAGTVDIFPTVAAAAGLPAGATMATIDGANLLPVFAQETGPRTKPLGFRHQRRGAWIDQRYKLVCPNVQATPPKYELYDLETDPKESRDLAAEQPEVLARLRGAFEAWNASVQASADGKDYPEGRVDPQHPPSRDWTSAPEYAAYVPQWKDRVEFRAYIERAAKGGKKKQ